MLEHKELDASSLALVLAEKTPHDLYRYGFFLLSGMQICADTNMQQLILEKLRIPS